MANSGPRLSESIKSLTAWYALVAALSYVILYMSYSQYYSRFGIYPREVGLDRAELLSDALVGPLVVTAGLAALIIIPTTLYLLSVLFYFWYFSSLTATLAYVSGGPLPFGRLMRPTLRGLAQFVITIVAVSLVIVGVYVFRGAISRADHIKTEGRLTKEPELALAGIVVPLLETETHLATVVWKDSQKTPPILEGDAAKCLVYLGQNGSTVVLFDFRDDETLRVPAGDILITLNLEAINLPQSCMKPEDTK